MDIIFEEEMDKFQVMEFEKKIFYLSESIQGFVSEVYVKSCLDILQIFGAFGYSVESGIEKEVRDALASKIYSGASEIQLNIIYQLSSNNIVSKTRAGDV